jgi:putative DNA primase/helicase
MMTMRAEDIANALGGKRSGRQYACRCPAHEDSSPSLIVFDGRECVQVRCMAGCANDDVIAALRKRGIWQAGGRPLPREDGRERPLMEPKIAPLEYEPSSQGGDDDLPLLPTNHRELGLDIFSRGADVRGTLAERYLEGGRNIPVPKRSFNFMRYVPWCPKGRLRVPALVALMRTVTDDAPAAIQRVFLDAEARKTGMMMLGPSANAAMKLGDERPPMGRLYVCEGLETGLALMGAGYGPVWALGSSGAMGRFPRIAVERLVVCADNDRAGMEAATALRRRYGEKAVIWKPNGEGLDFADVLGGTREREA